MIRSRRLIVAAAALVATGVLSGCAIHTGANRSSSGRTVVISEGANGRQVKVRAGDHLTVVLHSTYWMISGGTNPRVMTPLGVQQTKPDENGCVPGEGCGTASRSFLAKAQGTVTLRAHRTSCGEALRCTGRDGTFIARVEVVG